MRKGIYITACLDVTVEDPRLSDRYCVYALNSKWGVVGDNTIVVDVDEVGQQPIYTKGAELTVEWGASSSGLKNKTLSAYSLRPLFLFYADDSVVHTYSAVIFHDLKIAFQRSGSARLDLQGDWDEIVEHARKNHLKNRAALSNHDAWFRKYHEDCELEYKLNISPDLNTWALSNYFYDSIKQGQLEGFIPQIQDHFNQWDFKNYLFEVVSPEEIRGYISFIECPNNKYVMKQKIFRSDSFERIELRTKNLTIKTTMEEHLDRQFPGIKYIRHKPFSRRRYDVNLESITSGNIYSIMFDYSWVIEDDSKKLAQCEIEYLKSRTVFPPRKVVHEQKKVLSFVLDNFKALGVKYDKTFYSKLSFLRDVQAL